MYKVFFKDRLIYLDDDIHSVSDKQSDYVGVYGSFPELKAQLDTWFRAENQKDLFLYHHDLDELYRNFEAYFKYIHAAGGLVRNEKNESLFIFRRGKWDLPKGKPHADETPEQTAIREVEEECGIHGVTISRFIVSTYHIYYLKEKTVLKRTDWFEMKYDGNETPDPYEKEGITDYRWVADSHTDTVSENTYPAILEVIQEYEKIM